MKRLDLVKHLEKNKCKFHRQGSKHEIYINTQNNKVTSVPRHKNLPLGTVRAICKQLEIPLC